MEFLEVIPPKNSTWETKGTIWLTYDVNGKWYSKILSYGGEIISESVPHGNRAYYHSPELEQVLAELIAKTRNIENYSQAKITNSQTISSRDGNSALVDVGPEEFQLILDLVEEKNKFTPTTDIVERFQDILENSVPLGDNSIYGIELLTGRDVELVMQNFMIYDNLTQVLWFEDNYYHVNLLCFGNCLLF